MTISRLFSGVDTRLQIDPVSDTAWDKRRSKEQRTTVRLRVGTEWKEVEGKKRKVPTWAEWPVTLHRPLPTAAKIRWAQVLRKVIAGKERWSLHLTLEVPDDYFEEKCGHGTVAIDIGWRKKGDDLRVAYWRDDRGEHGEFLINDPKPEKPKRKKAQSKKRERQELSILQELQKVDDLQSIRDQHLNEMRPILWKWLKEHDTPEWLDNEAHHLFNWQSQARFARLALKWRDNHWAGDAFGYFILEWWRRCDKHLWTWQENLRDQTQRRRKYRYQQFAVKLSRRYQTLVLEESFLKKTQQRQPLESTKKEVEAVKLQQKRASCYSLRECLIRAFVKRGGDVYEEQPAYTTQICHLCGDSTPWDAAPNIEHTCVGCGTVWDQDNNACANLLTLFDERCRTGKNVGGVCGNLSAKLRKKQPSMWAKRKAKKGTSRKVHGTESVNI